MTLREAAREFSHRIPGFDPGALNGQDEAYERCQDFLREIEKTRSAFNRTDSYKLKHFVEDPTGNSGIGGGEARHCCYVYEGTFILAALACGFVIRHPAESRVMNVRFNLSQISLAARAKRWADEWRAKDHEQEEPVTL
jgi:hypothetical protein